MKEFEVIFDASGDFEIRQVPGGANGQFSFETRAAAIEATIEHYREIERAIFHRLRKARRLKRMLKNSNTPTP